MDRVWGDLTQDEQLKLLNALGVPTQKEYYNKDLNTGLTKANITSIVIIIKDIF